MATSTMLKLPSIRKNLSEMKGLLVNDNRRANHKIRFRKNGDNYTILSQEDKLRSKLEKSFNSFMNELDVKKTGKKVRGLLFIDKNSETFSLGYQNEGEPVLHQIKGRVG